MHGWRRVGVLLAAVATVAALAGCGQLFAQSQGTVTLSELSNRVDSLDAQVGELQAALASGAGSGSGMTAQQTEQNGVVQSDLPVATVEADVLNVRSDPELTGTVQGQLLQNARVNVLAVQGNWSEIKFTNPVTGLTLTGWVDNEYLGPSTIPPTPTGVSSTSSDAGTASATTTASVTSASSSASG